MKIKSAYQKFQFTKHLSFVGIVSLLGFYLRDSPGLSDPHMVHPIVKGCFVQLCSHPDWVWQFRRWKPTTRSISSLVVSHLRRRLTILREKYALDSQIYSSLFWLCIDFHVRHCPSLAGLLLCPDSCVHLYKCIVAHGYKRKGTVLDSCIQDNPTQK